MPQGLAGHGQGQEQQWPSPPSMYKWSSQGAVEAEGPDGIHPTVLRECTELLTEILSIISQESWLTQEVTVDWKLANVVFICKKGKEDTGNYRTVSLMSVP